MVVLSARLNAAFRSSMEVEVEVKVEDAMTGHRRRCVDAFMTFVSIDAEGKTSPVPPLIAESSDDERRAREAGERRAARLASKR